MKKGVTVGTWMVLVVCLLATVAVASGTATMTPDAALAALMEGNASFAAGDLSHLQAHSTQEVRAELAGGQHPYAIIVDCSDSRLSPEIIFDKGLGEVFVVRVAGNIVAPHQLGSIEYAIEHLGASLVMVLGHSKCGAVNATVGSLKAGTCEVNSVDGNIGSLVESIAPAVEKACESHPADLLAASIDENINYVAKRIEKKSPIVREAVETGKVKVVKARYDLEDGKVHLFGDHE